MTEPFSRSATQLCGLICRQLGWRVHDFWEATPAEIISILADQNGSQASGLSREDLTTMMEQDDHG